MKKWSLLPLVILCLAACQNTPLTNDESSAFKIRQDNTCGTDDLRADTAGWHRSGSVGGIGLVNPQNKGIKVQDIVTANAIAWDIQAALKLKNLSQDVVMFIVDDFGSSQTQSGESVYRLDPIVYSLKYDSFTQDSSTLPLKQLSIQLKSLLEQGQLSHGAMVLTYTADLLQSLGANLLFEQEDKLVLSLDEATLTLKAVEVSGLNTAQIKNVLESAMDNYQNIGHSNFVVNFSFTLEPCDKKQTSKHRHSTKTLPTLGPGNALYDFVEKNPKTIYVAASGNHLGEMPHAPANWPSVVSTSASIGQKKFSWFGASEKLAFFSNHGEVMMRGAWLRLRDPFAINNVNSQATEVVLAGNSLSSPAVAIASMLDLSQNKTRCLDSSHKSNLAHGSYTNLTLEAAVNQLCSPQQFGPVNK